MTTANTSDQGRESFRQQAWADAYAQLSAANREHPLNPEDLDLLARAAYLTGRDAECADMWTRAHHDLSTEAIQNKPPNAPFGWDWY